MVQRGVTEGEPGALATGGRKSLRRLDLRSLTLPARLPESVTLLSSDSNQAWVGKGKRTLLERWYHVLALGPPLPLWLSESLVMPLELEKSYEQACHDLWIA